MSRCFPFPPPGYENNERSSHADLLEKEKHKEQKDKKEKKDKEKREGKFKKEKDRSKDKRKEKKDKKEKHKEKKKHKDRDKTKGVADSTNKQKDSHHESNFGEPIQKNEETNHSKFTMELARRIKDDKEIKESTMVENCNGSVQRSTNGSASATLRVMERCAGSHSSLASTSTSQRSANGLDSAAFLVTERAAGSRDISPFKSASHRSTNGLDSASLRLVEGVTGSHSISTSTSAAQRSTDGLDSATLRVTGRVASSHSISPSTGAARRSTDGSYSATLHATGRFADRQSISPSTCASQRTPDMEKIPNNLSSSTRKVKSLGSIQVLQKESNSSESKQKLKLAGETGAGGSPLPMGKPVGSIQGQFGGSHSTPAVEARKISVNQVISNPSTSVPKTINGMHKPVEGIFNMGNKAFNTNSSSTKAEDREINKISTNHILLGQRNAEGIVRSAEDTPDKLVEGKEKKKDKKDKKGKHRDKDRDEKRRKKKEQDKDKEKEKEKTKIIDEDQSEHKMYDEPRDGRKADHIGSPKAKPLTLQSVGAYYPFDENIKKRKEVEMNGLRLENNMPPNKIARTTPSPHTFVKKGSLLELPHISSASSSMKSETMNNIIPGQRPADVNKCIANVEADLRHPVTKDLGTAGKVSLNSLKPPHPDAKYLSNIYTVPKLDHWPEYDDQEWLFSDFKIKQKSKPQVGAEENPQVYAEAVRFESEDVLALPYVVPF